MQKRSSDPLRTLRRLLAAEPDVTVAAAAAALGIRDASVAYVLAHERRRAAGRGTASAALAELLEFVVGCEADWQLDDRIRSAGC